MFAYQRRRQHLLTLRAALAEDFFFEIAETDFCPRISQLALDSIDLRVNCDDLVFGRHRLFDITDL